MDKRRLRATVVVIALSVVAPGCSSHEPTTPSRSQVGEPATISHIHGLGVDRADTPYIATHHGLIKADGARWVYASADTNDHMGFSLHPGAGVMFRSGHSLQKPTLGVESSTDGIQWTHLSDVAEPPVDFHAMAVSFANPRMLWGWDSGGRGTFRSTNGGRDWTRLEAKGIERQIYVLAGSAEDNVVFAGTATGLYRSADGGATWRRSQALGDGWVLGIGSDPANPDHVLAYTSRGMRSTTDGGKTWLGAGDGLPPDAKIGSIAISPVDPMRAYAADAQKIYTTTDGGRSWNVVPTD